MIEYKHRFSTEWKIFPQKFEFRFQEEYAYMYSFLQVRIQGKVYKISDPQAKLAFDKEKMWEKLSES